MTEIKIEIGQYREMNKGALKAFFSLVIYPEGQKIIDCRHFIQGTNQWFSFPQKEIKRAEGGKSEYIPYISYLNKEYLEALKNAVLNALKEGKYEQVKSNQSSTKASEFQSKASSDEGQVPF